MPLAKVYRKTGEGSISSYSFYDLATGTAYKTFYGMDAISGSSVIRNLSPDTITSLTGYDSQTNQKQDLDFDLQINKPLTLYGDAIINVPISAVNAGAMGNIPIVISGAIMLVRNGTETQLGNTAVNTLNFINLTTRQWKMSTQVIGVPLTTLQPGDKVRFNVIAPAFDANTTIYIHHDPNGLYVTAIDLDTRLKVNLPLAIDL